MIKIDQFEGEFLTKKGKQTQQAIIRTVMSMIRTRGFAETTVKEICTEAGIGVGTFYHYFHSKEEVLFAFIGEEDNQLKSFYAQMDRKSYGDAIMGVLNYYLDLYFIKGAKLVAQIYSSILFSEVEVVSEFLGNSFYAILHDAFENGQRSGEFSDQISVETLCNTFVGTWFFFTSLWCNNEEEYDIRGNVNTHFPRLIQMISTSKN